MSGIITKINSNPDNLDNLVLHSGLGSVDEIENCIKGTGLAYPVSLSTPTHPEGRFGNALHIDNTAPTGDVNSSSILSGGVIPTSAFTLEFYANAKKYPPLSGPNYYQGVIMQGGAELTVDGNAIINIIFTYGRNAGGVSYGIALALYMRVSGANQTKCKYVYNVTNSSGYQAMLPLDEWIHWAFTYDNSLVGSGQAWRAYRNGTELSLTLNSENASYTMDQYFLWQYFGTDTGAWGWGGYLDNLKIYSEAKSDFRDRFYENGFYPQNDFESISDEVISISEPGEHIIL